MFVINCIQRKDSGIFSNQIIFVAYLSLFSISVSILTAIATTTGVTSCLFDCSEFGTIKIRILAMTHPQPAMAS